jgi:hypothetical protein
MSTGSLFHDEMSETTGFGRASACPMVAFSGFYESHEPPPLSNVRGLVPLHRNGHRNVQQSGYILHNCCVDCCPGDLRGNTE